MDLTNDRRPKLANGLLENFDTVYFIDSYGRAAACERLEEQFGVAWNSNGIRQFEIGISNGIPVQLQVETVNVAGRRFAFLEMVGSISSLPILEDWVARNGGSATVTSLSGPTSAIDRGEPDRGNSQLHILSPMEIDPNLMQAVYIIEASDFAREDLKKVWENRVAWETSSTKSVVLGIWEGVPTQIEISPTKIDGRVVLFWHAEGEVTNYRFIDDWLSLYFGEEGSRLHVPREDAMNFHNCLAEIVYLNRDRSLRIEDAAISRLVP